MPRPKRIIALSPTPECLCLAAICRSAWDDLMIAGRNLILDVIEELNTGPSNVKELLILVPQVIKVQEVRKSLITLASKGVAVTWFALGSSESVRTVTRDIKGVALHTGLTLGDAIRTQFHRDFPLLKDLDNSKPDLADFLRYRISLSFMRVMAPQPLIDAVNELAKCGNTPFSISRLKAADKASVAHFRDADFPYIEGQTDRVMALKSRIRAVAPTDLSVLILGETGTGKESIAFYIHEFSNRRSRPFVALNCAGLQETFLRSELFGHKKGSFTGAITDKKGLVEEANGGTLFLDEVGEMPLTIQADLLRFLQTRRFRPMGETTERSVDLRIVAATQPDLKEKIKKNEFRSDLYFRIADVEIVSPPLREVPDDIIRLVRHIAYRCNGDAPIPKSTAGLEEAGIEAANESDRPKPTPEATIDYFEKHESKLRALPLPGNVRQLIQLVRCRHLLGDDVLGDAATQHHNSFLSPGGHPGVPAGNGSSSASPIFPPNITRAKEIIPLDHLTQAYVRNLWNRKADLDLTQKELSNRLGISVNTLKKHLNG